MAEKSSWDEAKTRFGLEKQKENQPNYQRLILLTVLPLNYFMEKRDLEEDFYCCCREISFVAKLKEAETFTDFSLQKDECAQRTAAQLGQNPLVQ